MRTTGWLIAFLLVAGTANAVQAQASGPRDLAFGFSGMTYLVEPADAIFTDPEEHLTGNFGFRLTKAFYAGRRFGWMVDGELYLGVAHRLVLDVDLPNTIVGLQAYAGPVVSLGKVQVYGTFGLNRTTVGESKIVTVPGPVLVTYVAGGGISQAWSDIMTARARNAGGGGDILASIPPYEKLVAAGMFGIAYEFGGRRGGFRLSLDLIPMFMTPTRNNFRVTFSIAG